MKKKFILTLLVAAAMAAPVGAIDRGLGNPKSVYIPKGTVAASLTGGYNSWNATGEELTQGVAAMNKLAAGSLFTGKMGGIDFLKMSAKLYWGVPFTSRPAALEGYVCSQPKTIDYAEGEHADKKGQMDKAAVVVILTDWEEQFLVSPPDILVDVENDPHIIGYGKMVFEKDMTEYEKFHLDIAYRNDRTPTMATIVTSSSYLGDYFTGGSGSVVYFDEFQFIYY